MGKGRSVSLGTSGGIGAFCSANITWKSGERLRSRAGASLLDQPLEGHVLVRVGAERHLAHPPEQLAEGRSPERSVRSTSVLTKKPMSPSSLRLRAVGDGRADDDVVLPAVAMEQHLEGREQGHEQRDPFSPAHVEQRRHDLPGHPDDVRGAAVGLHRGARPIGGERQRGGSPPSLSFQYAS